MKNFNKYSGGGDKRGGSGSRENRPSYDNRFNSDRPQMMHHAICAECKKDCEVPFRPNGEKPVYCRECFSNHGGPSTFDNRASGKRDFAAPARAPYQSDKPRETAPDRRIDDLKRQIEALHTKLDRFMESMSVKPQKSPEKLVVAEKPTPAPKKKVAVKREEKKAPKKKKAAKK